MYELRGPLLLIAPLRSIPTWWVLAMTSFCTGAVDCSCPRIRCGLLWCFSFSLWTLVCWRLLVNAISSILYQISWIMRLLFKKSRVCMNKLRQLYVDVYFLYAAVAYIKPILTIAFNTTVTSTLWFQCQVNNDKEYLFISMRQDTPYRFSIRLPWIWLGLVPP